jgi:5-methylcytosine-specific restriction enzyme A
MSTSSPDWKQSAKVVTMFVPGQIIRRKDLHASFGGQEQGGISTPASHPFIMLFTGASGLSHGYEDGWTETGIFLYSGEGQLGDMSFVRGSRALRDHLKDGRDVHLFEYIGPGFVQYAGQMTVSGYHERKGADSIGSERNAIVFELIPAQDPLQQGNSLDESSFLDNAPNADIQRLLELPPTTTATPEERQTATLRRSRALRVFVLRRANGTCEGCGQAAPFETVAGTP